MSNTRKDRERNFKKREILEAAKCLFAEKGYHLTTLEEIADKAEFGKGTIYNYFKNKDDIYYEIIKVIFEEYSAMLECFSNKEIGFRDFVLETTRATFKYAVENSCTMMMVLRARIDLFYSEEKGKRAVIRKHNMRSLDIFKQKIEEGIKKGEINEIDPEKFVFLYRSMVFPFMQVMFFSRITKKADPDEMAEFVTDIIFNGIAKK
ncbi:MAG: TetR/AcrR family transcriptional regulator [Melioribacteraceae bacterium]|nr:TetR/AcrR family transcriptional regulator [Melioribacteraceae bacterium]MCO6473257.1 TetR/AcrR family transcriptional regulator [Melioribacteraceae bacterium]MDD3559056.1 TetR/AcrR family transcriptional regulator [Melioribacteraceae bacterium]